MPMISPFNSIKTEAKFTELVLIEIFIMDDCPLQPSNESGSGWETIYADFDADAYNDLIEYQFRKIVKLMSGLGMGKSIQEKVLKELSANLAALMVVENWNDEAGWSDYPTNSLPSDTLQVKSHY